MFPNNIKAEMARNELSQSDLATLLDVSPTTVKNWLCGKTEIPSSALIRMSKEWRVSADYLLSLEKTG